MWTCDVDDLIRCLVWNIIIESPTWSAQRQSMQDSVRSARPLALSSGSVKNGHRLQRITKIPLQVRRLKQTLLIQRLVNLGLEIDKLLRALQLLLQRSEVPVEHRVVPLPRHPHFRIL